MSETCHITRYCTLRNHTIRLNGESLYTGTDDSPAGFFNSVYRMLDTGYAKFFKMDPLCKLGFLATEILLRDSGLGQNYAPAEVAIVLSNASSSVEADRNHRQSIANRDSYFPSPSVFVYTLANIVIGEICIRHKIHGEGMFFIGKKFDPGILYNYVTRLLDDGVAGACITGWVEVNGDDYEAVVYLIEKQAGLNSGIAIFNAENLFNLYQQTD